MNLGLKTVSLTADFILSSTVKYCAAINPRNDNDLN